MRAPLLLSFVSLTLTQALGCSEPVTPIHDVGDLDPGPLPIGTGEGEGDVASEGEGDVVAGEGEGDVVAGEGEGESGCAISVAGDPEKARVVLVGHNFTDDPNVHGTEIRSLTLNAETLTDNGMRLDVHAEPARIAFVPSGEYALVLGDRGHVASVRVEGAGNLAIASELDLPGAGYGDLRMGNAEGTRFYAMNFDSTGEAGVHIIDVACDGTLSEDAAGFFPMRLSNSLAPLPGGRAVLLGGQAVFDPLDANDVRLLQLGPPTTQVAPFDFFQDGIDDTRIGASPDGTRAAIPNASPFSTEGGDIALLSITGNTISEIDRVHGFSDCAEAMFSPDGSTLLVSQAEPNRVAVFDVTSGTLVQGTSIEHVGLAEQMDMITRGSETGLVLVAATNSVGNIHMLRITGAGQAVDLGKLDLGSALADIPDAIAIQP